MALFLILLSTGFAGSILAKTTWSENLVLADCGIGRGPNGGSTSRQMMYYSNKAWGTPNWMVDVPWDGSYPWRDGGVKRTLPNGDEWTVLIHNETPDPGLAGWAVHTYDAEALLCWSRHVDGLYTLDDGTPCSMAFICNHAPAPQPTTPAPAPTPTPPAPAPPHPTPTVHIEVSKQYVDFDGHIDPKWWFDNRIEQLGSQSCKPDGKTDGSDMPGDYVLNYECDGGDGDVITIMRAALNGAVDATINNADLAEKDRVFMHGTRTVQQCAPMDPQHHCWDEEQKFTRFPQAINIITSGKADDQWFPQGHFSYWITHEQSFGCRLCAFFGGSSGLAGTATGVYNAVSASAASFAGPAAAFGFAVINMVCLLDCNA